MTNTQVREMYHFVLHFRCGCAANLTIEGGMGKADMANRGCRKHRNRPAAPVMDILVPGKLVRVEFHSPHLGAVPTEAS